MNKYMNAASDMHLDPGELPDLRGLDVLCGDTLNLLPYGMKAWLGIDGQRTVDAVCNANPNAIWVAGNHDPKRWLDRLLEPYGLQSYRKVELGGWTFEHGHRLAGDWHFLRHVAPGATEILTTLPVIDGWWYAFCRKMGWMASGAQQGAKRYQDFVGLVWANALRERKNLVIGHTHTRVEITTPWFTLMDLGANEMTTF